MADETDDARSATTSAEGRGAAVWDDERRDVLGEPWVARTLHLPPDAETAREGVEPVATLVHRPARHRRAALYVHGFVDYFFHPHVADALDAAGWDLYALDLRDYGRSIRPGRPPNHTRELATYAQEIDAAVALLREDRGRARYRGNDRQDTDVTGSRHSLSSSSRQRRRGAGRRCRTERASIRGVDLRANAQRRRISAAPTKGLSCVSLWNDMRPGTLFLSSVSRLCLATT